MPERVQLRRVKGYRKPEGAVTVARPSKWGNPFPIEGPWAMWAAVGLGYHAGPGGRRAMVVALHRSWLTGEPIRLGPFAGDAIGGAIEFSDGTVRTLNEHAMGIAMHAASLYEGPTCIPEPPALDDLRGHDLACWCPLDQPCHADVLLEAANG